MTAGSAASRRVLGWTPVAPLPASSPTRPTGITGRMSAPPETSSPGVCSFRLPQMCGFRLPLTRGSYLPRLFANRSQPAGRFFAAGAVRRRGAMARGADLPDDASGWCSCPRARPRQYDPGSDHSRVSRVRLRADRGPRSQAPEGFATARVFFTVMCPRAGGVRGGIREAPGPGVERACDGVSVRSCV